MGADRVRVLITGGLGYLGGRLAQFLSSGTGVEIFLGSRQSSSPPAWLPEAKMVQTCWESPTRLEDVCAGIDAVIHLAGMNAQDCAATPDAALEFNGVATARLLQSAIRQGVKRFIYLSTAHVYASPLSGTISEETCPLSLHPYATSHRAGEDVVRAAHQRGEIEGVVIRLSNSFGKPVHAKADCWMLLVNDLCRQAVTTRQMVLSSSGLQRRDFVPLSDVCHAIRHLLHLPQSGLGTGLFNLGGGWSPTVWEMACLVQERCATVLGYRPGLTRKPANIGEMTADLDYRSDRLLQSGFQPSNDRVFEIDHLLEFCQVTFD